jgi:hypothetical protein
MSTSNAFEWLCDDLESATDLDRLAARDTPEAVFERLGG